MAQPATVDESWNFDKYSYAHAVTSYNSTYFPQIQVSIQHKLN